MSLLDRIFEALDPEKRKADLLALYQHPNTPEGERKAAAAAFKRHFGVHPDDYEKPKPPTNIYAARARKKREAFQRAQRRQQQAAPQHESRATMNFYDRVVSEGKAVAAPAPGGGDGPEDWREKLKRQLERMRGRPMWPKPKGQNGMKWPRQGPQPPRGGPQESIMSLYDRVTLEQSDPLKMPFVKRPSVRARLEKRAAGLPQLPSDPARRKTAISGYATHKLASWSKKSLGTAADYDEGRPSELKQSRPRSRAARRRAAVGEQLAHTLYDRVLGEGEEAIDTIKVNKITTSRTIKAWSFR